MTLKQLLTLFLVTSVTFASCAHLSSSPAKLQLTSNSVMLLRGTAISTDPITESTTQFSYTATAFAIKENDDGTDFLTNKHACIPGAKITLTDSNNEKYKANVVRVSEMDDLCLLHSDGAHVAPMPLNKKDAEYGEEVIVNGCGRGICGQITFGFAGRYTNINTTEEVELHSREQFLTAPIYAGNSGSFVLNKHGHVVGIINMGYEGTPTISLMVPVELIHRFLNEKQVNVVLAE